MRLRRLDIRRGFAGGCARKCVFCDKQNSENVISTTKRKGHRKLGLLEGKGEVIFSEDFKITDEEFLGYRGRRKLGIFNGMPGYFMRDDFCETTKEEFNV